jgi:mRNA interferase RelE/StbE
VSGERALRFTRTAEKELRRLDPPIRARVLGALDRLSADDRSLDVRRLTGSAHFRLRVGDWRVIFDYDRATQTVPVRHVLPRGREYDHRGVDRYTDVQHGIRREWASGKPGIEVVWRAANRMQKPESPAFKRTLTVRPDNPKSR